MRADRLLSILLLLQTRGRMPARELARRLEVSERTIYRDLDALGTAGVPVYAERGRHGDCALIEGYRTDLTGLTGTEVRTLFAVRAVGYLSDLGLDAAGEAALLKLLAALPAASRRDAERSLARIHLDPDVWFHTPEPAPYLSVAHEAVWQERRLRLTYQRSDGSITAGVVEPLGLVAKARLWYLVAAEGEGLRVFRVARIQDAALLDDRFTRPDCFDLPSYWASWRAAFERSIPSYSVVVRVLPAAMPHVQDLLGEEVGIHMERATPPDARGRRTIPVTFERIDDARRALLGCGPLVEAIEPPELRESIAEAIAKLSALYTGVSPVRQQDRDCGREPATDVAWRTTDTDVSRP